MSNQGKNLALGLGVGAVLFLGINALATPLLRTVRLDLTEQELYTLSDGTRALMGRLEEPITLRLYFSKSLVEDNPGIVNYARRVEEMLRELASASKGKIDLAIIDPLPFSEDEDRASAFGIQGAPVNIAGDMFYFGLVGTNATDGEEVIAGLDPSKEAQLEYQLTELIDRLANPTKPVVGLISSYPLSGGSQPGQFGQPQQTPPWAILDVLNKRFDVRTLEPASLTEIPHEVTTLVMIHPKGLSVAAQYAIDQWCLAGGKVVAFVDSFAEFDPERSASRSGQNPAAAFEAQLASEIDELLKAWGVELRPGVVAGDRALALQIPDRKRVPVEFPPFIELGADQLSKSDILTQSLTKVRMLVPGALAVREDKLAGTKVETLFGTTVTGGTIDTMGLLPEPDPVAINASFPTGDTVIPLAMRISGTIRSAFPNGAPEKPIDLEEPIDSENPEDPATPEAAHLSESSAPFNAIVVADADMLYDALWSRPTQDLFGNRGYYPTADNAALLVNALENLSGSDELISLRSRADYRRPFERKEKLAALAQERFRAEEERLEGELRATEAELQELQKKKDPSQALFLSPEQEKKLEEFREKQLETRRELRKVKSELRTDIDSLGSWLKFLNTLAVPLALLLGVGTYFFALRRR